MSERRQDEKIDDELRWEIHVRQDHGSQPIITRNRNLVNENWPLHGLGGHSTTRLSEAT